MSAAQILEAALIACIGIAATATIALIFWHASIVIDRVIAAGGW